MKTVETPIIEAWESKGTQAQGSWTTTETRTLEPFAESANGTCQPGRRAMGVSCYSARAVRTST